MCAYRATAHIFGSLNAKCGYQLKSRKCIIYQIMCITEHVSTASHGILHMHLLAVLFTDVRVRNYQPCSRVINMYFHSTANPLKNSLHWRAPLSSHAFIGKNNLGVGVKTWQSRWPWKRTTASYWGLSEIPHVSGHWSHAPSSCGHTPTVNEAWCNNSTSGPTRGSPTVWAQTFVHIAQRKRLDSSLSPTCACSACRRQPVPVQHAAWVKSAGGEELHQQRAFVPEADGRTVLSPQHRLVLSLHTIHVVRVQLMLSQCARQALGMCQQQQDVSQCCVLCQNTGARLLEVQTS